MTRAITLIDTEPRAGTRSFELPPKAPNEELVIGRSASGRGIEPSHVHFRSVLGDE